MTPETIISFLSNVNSLYIYLAVFLIAYIENIFPPFPSDLIVAFCGYLAGIDRVSIILVILISTFGSATGFMTMYQLGKFFGIKIVERGKLKFISLKSIKTIERWFEKYGYWVVIANRFLAGTRAVVSFFTGLSELNFKKTTVLSSISALLWNSIIIFFGYLLGKNWHLIGDYLHRYTILITCIIILVIIFFFLKHFIRVKFNK